MEDFCDNSSVREARSSNTDYRWARETEVDDDDDDDDEEEEEEESSWTTYIVDFLINGQEKVTPSSHLSQEEWSSAVVSDKVGLRRRKNKGSLVDRVDEALEDTASSPPIHTPKKKDKGISSSDEVSVGSGRGGGGGDSRLLKERELCLVPLSMVVNYLG